MKKTDLTRQRRERILDEIGKELDRLTYGVITITVHDSQIVQMEITEKRRFDKFGSWEQGDGI